MYKIVYSTGTTRHDEERFVMRNIPAANLARRIARLQLEGKSIYSVERVTELGA